jgi:hypothetical protein
VRLHAAQRTQPQSAQFALQDADVDPPHGQIVCQVASTRCAFRRNEAQPVIQFILDGHRIFAQPLDGKPHAAHKGVARLLVGHLFLLAGHAGFPQST